MSSSSSDLPAPEGPGSVSGAPNLPAGFSGTFTGRYVDSSKFDAAFGRLEPTPPPRDAVRQTVAWYRSR